LHDTEWQLIQRGFNPEHFEDSSISAQVAHHWSEIKRAWNANSRNRWYRIAQSRLLMSLMKTQFIVII